MGAASEKATKLDVLFAAKAAGKEINNRIKALEDEVKAEFMEEYEQGGTDRKRSTVFGKEAGYLTMKEGKPSEHVTRFQVDDPQKVVDWMDYVKPETDSFASDNLEMFAKWWFEHTGEMPDGCTLFEYDTEPTKPTPMLSVKEKVVIPMLKANNVLSGEVNQLLLGDGE